MTKYATRSESRQTIKSNIHLAKNELEIPLIIRPKHRPLLIKCS